MWNTKILEYFGDTHEYRSDKHEYLIDTHEYLSDKHEYLTDKHEYRCDKHEYFGPSPTSPCSVPVPERGPNFSPRARSPLFAHAR
jgi:hypothetical protein